MLVPVIVKIALAVGRLGGVDLLLPPHAETLANNPVAKSIKSAAWRRRLPPLEDTPAGRAEKRFVRDVRVPLCLQR